MEYPQSRSITRAIVLFGCIIPALCLLFTCVFSLPALAAGKAYVTNVYGTNVTVVDIDTNSVIKTIPLYSPSADCSTKTPYLHDIEVVGSKVFVSVPGASTSACEINEVRVIDTATDTVVNSIATDRVPSGMKEYNGRLYVVNKVSRTIHEIDPNTETILRTITFQNPYPGYLENPSQIEIVNGKIYLPFAGISGWPGGVRVLDLATGNPSKFVNFGPVDSYGPVGIKQVAENRIYLGGVRDVAVLDTTSDTIVDVIRVKDETAGFVAGFAVANGKVYTANQESTVSVIDPAANTLITRISLAGHPEGAHPIVDIAAFGGRVYVTDPVDVNDDPQGIHIIDTATDTVVGRVPTTELFGVIDILPVKVTPGTGKAYVSNVRGSAISVIDLSSNSVIETIDLFTPSGTCASQSPYRNDITVIGSRVFVTVPGASTTQCEINEIKVIDTATGTVVGTIDTDRVPSGMKEYNGRLYVVNKLSRTIHEIDPNTGAILRDISFTNPNPGNIEDPAHIEIVNGKIYLPFPGSGGIAGGVKVLNLADGSVITFVDFGTVDKYGPRGIRQVSDDTIYLGGRFDVAVLDANTDTIEKTIHVKDEGAGYVHNFAVSSGKVYTANSESTVSVIDLSQGSFIKQIDVGAHPVVAHDQIDIAASGGRVYVTDHSDASGSPQGIKIIDTVTDMLIGSISSTEYWGAIETLPVQPVAPISKKAYISALAGKNVSVVNLDTNEVVRKIEIFTPSIGCAAVAPHINDIAILGRKVFLSVPGSMDTQCEVNQVKVIDSATDTVVNSIDTASAPGSFKVYNGMLYVLSRYGNRIHEIDPETETIVRDIPFSSIGSGNISNPKYFEIVNGKIYLPFAGTGSAPGGVVILNLSTGAYMNAINCGIMSYMGDPTWSYYGPTGIRQVASNKIYLGGRRGVAVVNPSTDAIVKVILNVKGETAGDILDFTVAKGLVFTANPESTVSVINPATDTFIGQFDIKAHPGDSHTIVDIIPFGDYLYVTDPMDESGAPQGFAIVDTRPLFATPPGPPQVLTGAIETDEFFGAMAIITILPPVPDIDPLPELSANETVTLIPPTATDFYGNIVTAYTNDPLVYNSPGTYSVEWIFEDAFGNVTTRTQAVVIRDETPPVLTCPEDMTVFSTGTLTQVFYEATAVDDFDPNVVIAYDPAPGSQFPVGASTVNVTATDASGNSAVCSFMVTVSAECIFRMGIRATGQGEEHGLSDATSVSEVFIGIDANAVTFDAASAPPNSTAYITLSGDLSEDIRQTGSEREEWRFTVEIGDFADPNLPGYYPVLSWDPNTLCRRESGWKSRLYAVDDQGGFTLLINDMGETNTYQTLEGEADCIPYAGCFMSYAIIWSEDVVVTMGLPKGWSLISLPLIVESAKLEDLFPEASVVYGFDKEEGYVRVKTDESLEQGRGYWILLPGAQTKTLTGASTGSYTLPVENGWYMIGACSGPSQASINTGTIEVIYGFDKDVGYQRITETQRLEEGRGYWILLRNTDEQSKLLVERAALPRMKAPDPEVESDLVWDLFIRGIGQDISGGTNASNVRIGMDANAFTAPAPGPPPNSTVHMEVQGATQSLLEDIRAIGADREVWFLTVIIGEYAEYGSDGYFPELRWDTNDIGPAERMELRRGHSETGVVLVEDMRLVDHYQTEGADGTYIPSIDEGILEYTVVFEPATFGTYYHDADEDGYGDPNDAIIAGSQPQGYVYNGNDCDDDDALINPNTIWYEDTDADGYGNANVSLVQCGRPEGYVLQARVATPAISPASGSFASTIAVTITCETTGATIRYTSDASAPDEDSPMYTGPFTLITSTTVKARAYKEGAVPSGTASATYTRQTGTATGGYYTGYYGGYPGYYGGYAGGSWGIPGGLAGGYGGYGYPSYGGYGVSYGGLMGGFIGYGGFPYGSLMGGFGTYGSPYYGGGLTSSLFGSGFYSPSFGSGFGYSLFNRGLGYPFSTGGFSSTYLGGTYGYGGTFGNLFGSGGISGNRPFGFTSLYPSYSLFGI